MPWTRPQPASAWQRGGSGPHTRFARGGSGSPDKDACSALLLTRRAPAAPPGWGPSEQRWPQTLRAPCGPARPRPPHARPARGRNATERTAARPRARSKPTCGEKTHRPPGAGLITAPRRRPGERARGSAACGRPTAPHLRHRTGGRAGDRAGEERAPRGARGQRPGVRAPGQRAVPSGLLRARPGAPAGHPASQRTPGVAQGSPESCGHCSRLSTPAPRPLPPQHSPRPRGLPGRPRCRGELNFLPTEGAERPRGAHVRVAAPPPHSGLLEHRRPRPLGTPGPQGKQPHLGRCGASQCLPVSESRPRALEPGTSALRTDRTRPVTTRQAIGRPGPGGRVTGGGVGRRPPRGQADTANTSPARAQNTYPGGVTRFCFRRGPVKPGSTGVGLGPPQRSHQQGTERTPAVLREQRAGEQVLPLLRQGTLPALLPGARDPHPLDTRVRPDGPTRACVLPGTRAPPRAKSTRTDATAPAQQERAHVHPLW